MKNLYELNDWNNTVESLKIGEILIEAGKINLMHLSMALDAQKFKKIQLGEIFIIMNAISREDLEQALYIQQTIKTKLENINEQN